MKVSLYIVALLVSLGLSTANAAPYELGYCSVKADATGPGNVCVAVRGKKASGVSPGTQHQDCTAAKANARNNLLSGIPAACGAYITCGDPCRVIQK